MPDNEMKLSLMAENLVGSEIIKLNGKINEMQSQGRRIFNYTIGDFDPGIFPIPGELLEGICKAYRSGETNYPSSQGLFELRKAVSDFYSVRQGLNVTPQRTIVACGARPLIYALYQAIADPGDKFVFPVPSWNNNHYTHLAGAVPVPVETIAANNFMPVASQLAPVLKGASMIALCSPLNPTGTVFSKQALQDICNLVIEENNRRKGQKPLYLLYDQIYWLLTYGKTVHYDPVSLVPEIEPYTIYIDGLTKAFSATGLRVGWAFGNERVIGKMRSILGHIGAWAPKAEQVAVSEFLINSKAVDGFLARQRSELEERLNLFYRGFTALAEQGYPVEAVPPQAAIYLTVRIDARGYHTAQGETLSTVEQVTDYLLQEAGIALVPFHAFGASGENPWYRLSVGTAKIEEISDFFECLRKALEKLRPAQMENRG